MIVFQKFCVSTEWIPSYDENFLKNEFNFFNGNDFAGGENSLENVLNTSKKVFYHNNWSTNDWIPRGDIYYDST